MSSGEDPRTHRARSPSHEGDVLRHLDVTRDLARRVRPPIRRHDDAVLWGSATREVHSNIA